jgi:hypothetical protein
MGGKSQSHLPSPFTSSTWLDLTTFVGLAAGPASNRGALTPDVDLDIFIVNLRTQTHERTSAQSISQPTDRNQISCLPHKRSSRLPPNRNHG